MEIKVLKNHLRKFPLMFETINPFYWTPAVYWNLGKMLEDVTEVVPSQ